VCIELRQSGGWSGVVAVGGAMTPAAGATPRSSAADDRSVTGQTPARTPMRDKLSINPDEDIYDDGDINEHQQVITGKQINNNLL